MAQPDIVRLQAIAGRENVTTNPADLYTYGSDASIHAAMPEVVVRPLTTQHVQEILRYANDALIPVVPRGSGSGMCGQVVPIGGGIVLDLKQLNRILEINVKDVYCRVEPGVVDDDLNKALKPLGFFYPPTPASSRIATIGGEIGNNASGVRSVKYGATRDSVLGMKVVLANGDLVTLGTTTRVEASGYQIERLMVGSEGTLGIVVEATLKFVPIPLFRCLGAVNFSTLELAGDAISEIMASGRDPSMLELMDNVAITAVNNALSLGLPDVEAILLFEADGMVQEAVEFEIQAMKHIFEKHGGFGIQSSYNEAERTKLFQGRKMLFPALSKYKAFLPTTSLADDMTVPYSKMAEVTRKIHDIASRHGVIMTAYGHCGSGCVHTKIMMDTKQKSQWESARRAVQDIYTYVREVGGTTSAEHGIGLSKAPDFKMEKRDSLDLMRRIKHAFDPNNILNPGKLMDAPDDWLSATGLRYPVQEPSG